MREFQNQVEEAGEPTCPWIPPWPCTADICHVHYDYAMMDTPEQNLQNLRLRTRLGWFRHRLMVCKQEIHFTHVLKLQIQGYSVAGVPGKSFLAQTSLLLT